MNDLYIYLLINVEFDSEIVQSALCQFCPDFLIIQMIDGSKQNYSKSQFSLAKIYYLGKHVIENIKRALHYFQLSTNHNNLCTINYGYILS